MKNGVCCQEGTADDNDEPAVLFDASVFSPLDPSQEPIFPPELRLNHDSFFGCALYFESDSMKWFRPNSLVQLLRQKDLHPEAKIVVGNTELGVEMKFKDAHYPVMIQPSQVRIS